MEEADGTTTSYGRRDSTRYMSVELAGELQSRHTLHSDIWAWGCLFIEVRYITHGLVEVAGFDPFTTDSS